MYSEVLDLRLQTQEVDDPTAVSCLPKGNHYEATTKSKVTVKRLFRMAENANKFKALTEVNWLSLCSNSFHFCIITDINIGSLCLHCMQSEITFLC